MIFAGLGAEYATMGLFGRVNEAPWLREAGADCVVVNEGKSVYSAMGHHCSVLTNVRT